MFIIGHAITQNEIKFYAMEYIYGHKNGMGYVHKNEFIYYSDRACTDEISRKTDVFWLVLTSQFRQYL